MILSNIRYSFLDAQNKASFQRASIRLFHEFNNILMEETTQDSENSITLYSSKTKIIFLIRKGDKTNQIVLNSKTPNYASEGISLTFDKPYKSVTLYENANKIINLISDLFIGSNYECLN